MARKMKTAQQIEEWNTRQLIKTKYANSRWRYEMPTCEDFGFRSDEINTIQSMQRQWEQERQCHYSQELKDIIKTEESKSKRAKNIAIIGYALINIVLWGFIIYSLFSDTDNRNHTLLLMIIAIVVSIVLGIIAKRAESWTSNRNIEEMKQEEENQHKKKVDKKYEMWIKKAKELEEYTEAVKVYNFLSMRNSYGFWQDLTGKGNEFEDEVRNFLESLGFEATRLPEGPDDGIDIIAKKNGINYAVQCKAHDSKISPTVARDLAGVVAGGGFDRGMLFALNGVSDNTKAWCRKSNVPIEIWTIDEIVKAKEGATPNYNHDYSSTTEIPQSRNSKSPPIKASSSGEAFTVGDKVSHPRFGEGTVLEVSGAVIRIEFEDKIRALAMEIAPIKKI